MTVDDATKAAAVKALTETLRSSDVPIVFSEPWFDALAQEQFAALAEVVDMLPKGTVAADKSRWFYLLAHPEHAVDIAREALGMVELERDRYGHVTAARAARVSTVDPWPNDVEMTDMCGCGHMLGRHAYGGDHADCDVTDCSCPDFHAPTMCDGNCTHAEARVSQAETQGVPASGSVPDRTLPPADEPAPKPGLDLVKALEDAVARARADRARSVVPTKEDSDG